MSRLSSKWHNSIAEISKEEWIHLVGEKTIPFFGREWLIQLEQSNSVSNATGWQPIHLSIWRDNVPIALAPLYIKGHSFGEFIFDHAFNQLALDLGLKYYPKLIGMSPFSPIEGYKFHFAPGEDQSKLTALIFQLIDSFAIDNNILSCNFLYVDQEWKILAKENDCAEWINQKSIWTSEGENNFSDYLDKFNSNQRRNIKRERKAVSSQGIEVTGMTGKDLNIDILRQMYFFYENHCARWGTWGSKYLSIEFFEGLSKTKHADQIIIFNAHRNNPSAPVGMSLCVSDGTSLWGRYWGSSENIDCLHFETCYYSPIEWAIKHNLHSFDPGAGGTHKRRRGFIAKPSTSLHRWYELRINSLIRNWLPKANELMLKRIEAENSELPFKSKNPEFF